MEKHPIHWPQFYTATILEWKFLLHNDLFKKNHYSKPEIYSRQQKNQTIRICHYEQSYLSYLASLT